MSKLFDVKITQTESELGAAIRALKEKNIDHTVGFVPTMGALHDGHLSLIKASQEHCNITICSIFVNPTQFNNAADLETYPRTVEADLALLEASGCDLVFLPSEKDIYPEGVQPYTIDLQGLDKVMEGPSRPGHFKGVCMVVERFFELVKPDFGFFGLKDFQQVAVLRKMVEVRELPIQIVAVPIKRNEHGLALSSRNALLSKQQRIDATLIHDALHAGIHMAQHTQDAAQIREHIISFFDDSYLEVEYISIVDNDTLLDVNKVSANSSVCAVVQCKKVRLIDNMQFASAFAE